MADGLGRNVGITLSIFVHAIGCLRLEFDDSVANRGTGGVESRRTSNHAHLQISDLNWDNEWVMYVEKQLGDEADGTVGYDVFEDKSVEINFDRMMMIIHNGAWH